MPLIQSKVAVLCSYDDEEILAWLWLKLDSLLIFNFLSLDYICPWVSFIFFYDI